MSDTYNIAIIGQTGVGKSALVNYLFGKDAPSGTGKPVTTKGFHRYDGLLNPFSGQSVKVKIFDSWGLEVGKEKEWNDMFKEELENRGVESHPKDWFHSVIYCIGASSNRVQNADIKIIEEALANEYPVTIALTKSDSVSEEDEADLIKEIEKSFIDGKSIRVVSVCAVEKETRNGSVKPFGKESLEKVIHSQVLSAITMRLPYCLQERLTKHLEAWYSSCKELIEEKTGSFGTNEVIEKLNQKNEQIKSLLESEKKATLESVFSAYQNVFRSHNSVETTITMKKNETYLSTYEKIFIAFSFPFLAPAALLYLAIKGKSENKEEILKEIKKTKNHFSSWIENEVLIIKKELNNMKSNTIPFLLENRNI